MELDKRIKEGKRPLTCFDAEMANQFIGKECYFSNCRVYYKNLSNFKKFVSLTDYCIGTLTAVMNLGDRVFDVDQQCTEFRYCLPCEWVQEQKESKWRAFKDHAEYKEFLNDGIIESWVKIKNKTTDDISELMYVGGVIDVVILGGIMFTVSDLFKNFELFNENTQEWQPFGVEEEEEKGDGL